MDLGSTGSVNKRHELIIGEELVLTAYNLRYLKRPASIDCVNTMTCELDPMVHEDIVNRAVISALRVKGIEQAIEQNQES
jgi:hypothetical protein